eukprot:6109771-Pyramimonas_sp.AAC.1
MQSSGRLEVQHTWNSRRSRAILRALGGSPRDLVERPRARCSEHADPTWLQMALGTVLEPIWAPPGPQRAPGC